MAITFVGSVTAVAVDGADATLDLTGIAGLAQNDVVLVCGAVPRLTAGGTSSTGWTQLETLDQTIIRGTVWRKVMGATPDTSFVLTGTANAADAACAHARAYRGVDTTTPEDAATTEVGGNSTNPDAPSITTVTDNAWVVAFAASQNADGSITAPSGYGNAASNSQADTRPVTMGSADITKAAAGAENPPSWTLWGTANWVAFTVALRPGGASAQNITGALFTDGDTFHAATVGRGAVNITGALFTDTDAFFGATLSSVYTITGALYADADTFHGATVAPGAASITGALFVDDDTFFGATIAADAVISEISRGGWLSEEQINAHDAHRRKRKTRQRELEETIELAYKRLTGKISAKAILEPTKDEPEKLAKLGAQLAAQLVTKGTDSARLRTRNAQIIADLNRLADEVLQYQTALQLEEEAIVMLLLA